MQFRDDIANGDWADLPGTVTALGTTGAKLDASAGGQGKRFYRVLLVQ